MDEYFHVPHFEIMLYDNPQLASAYLAAFQATGDAQYAGVLGGRLGGWLALLLLPLPPLLPQLLLPPLLQPLLLLPPLLQPLLLPPLLLLDRPTSAACTSPPAAQTWRAAC